MQTKQLDYNGATYTFRRRTVRDELQSRLFYRALYEQFGDDETEYIEQWVFFSDYNLRVTVEGDAEVAQVSASDDSATIAEAYNALMDADNEFGLMIDHGLRLVDTPINDPVLSPDADEKKD